MKPTDGGATLPEWLAALLGEHQAQLFHGQVLVADERIADLAKARQVEAPRGIGELTWLSVLPEGIDWSRFQNRRQADSYTGLCPGEHSTGQMRHELPRLVPKPLEEGWSARTSPQ